MKPIKLKIKGLNSFIEEQTIDFKKLTEAGFFGIFGPTGSGKSTVLDGITLALYGQVARKSSNFININCTSANVSFEFEIAGANPKKYIVEREFKTDKKTGNPRAGKCKVMDVTSDEVIILADSVNGLNSTCKEIIGLNIEDFTRTVVLPQGKFSEFLKLEGKSRRDMLERLFNLQQYGEELSRKLVREISKEKTENSVLLGELKGYEDVSEELKKAKETEVAESKNKYKVALDNLEKIKKAFIEGEEIWNLQRELRQHKEKEQLLESQEKAIIDKKNKVTLAESAERIIPYINAYERTEGELRKYEERLVNLKNMLELLTLEKEKALKLWESAKNDKEQKLPALKLKEQELKYALDDKRLVDKLQIEITGLNKAITVSENKVLDIEKKIKELKSQEATIKNEITTAELKQDTLKIDSSLKEKVQQGVRISERVAENLDRQKELTVKIERLKNNIARYNVENNKIVEALKIKKNDVTVKEASLLELNNNSPGEMEDLLALKEKLSFCTEAWNKYNTYINDIKITKESIETLSNKLKSGKELEALNEKNIAEIKLRIKEQETENLANRLREALTDDEPCPVCGSIHHEIENIKHIDSESVIALENELKVKENENKRITEGVLRLEAQISMSNTKVEELHIALNALGEEFKGTTVEELQGQFANLNNAIKVYNNKKLLLDNEIKTLKDEISLLDQRTTKASTVISQNENQLSIEVSDNDKNNFLLESATKELNLLSTETGITDFKAKNIEIIEMERAYEVLNLRLKKLRDDMEKVSDFKAKLENEFNKTKEGLAANKTSLAEKVLNRDEKIDRLKSKVQSIDNIEGELNAIQEAIVNIEESFKHSEEAKEEIETRYNNSNEKMIELTTAEKQFKMQLVSDEENLNKALSNENYSSAKTVKENIMTKAILDALKSEIEQHYDEKAKLKGAIETITVKLKDRSIDEEQWQTVRSEKEKVELDCDVLNKETIKLEEQLKTITAKLLELGDLLKKKEEIDNKLGLLADLDKLFKGKKFVEFVAATRLKYVSVEASKRLKEITNGNYGLEVDQDGRFIIRDYKNGGAERDASTLSGGETFVASLALALALSAEIQLKGTAPLELFFLDEGFGTLDDNLLEVVMSSLEKIHNDKLKIGLISHVEAIKNRVPIKLIVMPAVSGMGGSKVKIEKS